MAKTYNRLEIDVNKKPNSIGIRPVQNDTKSRYLDVCLYENGVAINLTGEQVRITFRKADGGTFFNQGEVTDATAGRCQFALTNEILSEAKAVEAQISVWNAGGQILSTQVFEINVTKTLLGNSSVESSNEYGTLVVLFQNLYEACALMTDMVSSFGKKGAVADARDIATFWQGVEYLAKYMDTDLKGLIEKALANASVQGVLDLIGTSGDNGNTTVFGKLNGMGAIKSIQMIKNNNGFNESDTYSISAVNPTKTFCYLQGCTISYSRGSKIKAYVASATTVKACGDGYGIIYVIEFS